MRKWKQEEQNDGMAQAKSEEENEDRQQVAIKWNMKSKMMTSQNAKMRAPLSLESLSSLSMRSHCYRRGDYVSTRTFVKTFVT
jgi:hypothetical protein